MKKLSILIHALFAACLAYAGKPSVNVANPMTADLDGGGFNIVNVLQLQANNKVTAPFARVDQLTAGNASFDTDVLIGVETIAGIPAISIWRRATDRVIL